MERRGRGGGRRAGDGRALSPRPTLAPFAGATNDPAEGSAGSPGATRVTLRLSRRVVASHRASRRTCASTRSAYTPSTAAGRFASALPLVSVSATLTTHPTARSCASAPTAERVKLNASDRPEATHPEARTRARGRRRDRAHVARHARQRVNRRSTRGRRRLEERRGMRATRQYSVARPRDIRHSQTRIADRITIGRDATGIVRRGKV